MQGGKGGLELLEAAGQLPADAGTLVRCLLLRAGHGGMACDVQLLAEAAKVWAERFAGNGGWPPDKTAATDAGSAWLGYLWDVASRAHSQLLDPGLP